MRNILILAAAMLVACSATEEEVVTTSVDVNQSDLGALLADIDKVTENALPLDAMLELAVSTPMDAEQQERYAVSFGGAGGEILFHVWREQLDWVHLYFSSTSKALITAIEESNSRYARDDDF